MVKAWKKKEGGNASGFSGDISSLPCVVTTLISRKIMVRSFTLLFVPVFHSLSLGFSSQVTL